MSQRWNLSDSLRARWNEGCDADTLLDECLSGLLETLRADCAIVFLGHPSGAASPWRGRDRSDQLSFEALEDASRSLVERCLTSGALVTWVPSADDVRHRSALELGIIAAIAAPIGDPVRGALYVDFRSARHAANVKNDGVVVEAASILSDVIAPTDFRPSVGAQPVAAPPPPDLDALLTLPGLYAMAPAIGVAVSNAAPVLVLGETGTGKTLLANALARRMERQPIVRATLGTTNDLNTITSELFGHVKGAYTGAAEARRGLVEQAHGGVLVFDEVLNLPLIAQQLLLDFTQFGEYRPLGYGGAAPKRSNVRLIAVTNGDLDAAVREGRFRQDLYHRLAGTVIDLPPLRRRRGDIPGLAAILLPQIAPGERWRLSRVARRTLMSERMEWSGNVREFEAMLRRAIARARTRPAEARFELTPEHLDPELIAALAAPSGGATPPVTELPTGDFKARWLALKERRAALLQEEDMLILEALRAYGGSKKEVAGALGVEYTTLTSRVARIQQKPTQEG